MISKLQLSIIFLFFSTTLFSQTSAQLEIRFAPDKHVYLAQDNRFLAIANFQIQNIAFLNTGTDTIKIDEIKVEVFEGSNLVKGNRYAGEVLEKNWQSLKSYIQLPGNIKSEDPRFRFKELLKDKFTLAETTTLKPNAAFFISRQFFFAQATVEFIEGKPKGTWPDRIKVSAKGTTSNGKPVVAENELQIINYQLKNEYWFPVRGRWYIGASSSVRSHHRLLPVHEFALDLIQIGEGGQSYKGDGTNLTDYYCYGKEVYAMADGEVVAVYDGIPETRLRRKDESPEDYRKAIMEPLSRSENAYIATGGNQIVLQHAGQEYSSYAHLQHGSITVKKGELVKRGQLIAKIGLSGDGYQPHLHFQLTDGPDINYSRGIPLIFQNVKPVLFSSTIDINPLRQFQAGEFIETTSE
jgi:murein DD-endopeptidase MepM/ murein hydrolase activator NlpD